MGALRPPHGYVPPAHPRRRTPTRSDAGELKYPPTPSGRGGGERGRSSPLVSITVAVTDHHPPRAGGAARHRPVVSSDVVDADVDRRTSQSPACKGRLLTDNGRRLSAEHVGAGVLLVGPIHEGMEMKTRHKRLTSTSTALHPAPPAVRLPAASALGSVPRGHPPAPPWSLNQGPLDLKNRGKGKARAASTTQARTPETHVKTELKKEDKV
ncbi:uncharacterized protein BXZ73DRAFT_106374 [Epithele typhae]|uniref:uncharacterized protein n=1 Tax=Epithele typhae TaxID=378194 RepID=UPI0020081523|nr:uncharacterized protein BXZ73DRAFT_106374 [Epithele typhae]KAH9915066.1 hypothetical protein BXZ73DRAFT_106374 [Epithele typhae]